MKRVTSASPSSSVIQQEEEGAGEKCGTNREATRGETETGGQPPPCHGQTSPRERHLVQCK